jgi:hypothetical protein
MSRLGGVMLKDVISSDGTIPLPLNQKTMPRSTYGEIVSRNASDVFPDTSITTSFYSICQFDMPINILATRYFDSFVKLFEKRGADGQIIEILEYIKGFREAPNKPIPKIDEVNGKLDELEQIQNMFYGLAILVSGYANTDLGTNIARYAAMRSFFKTGLFDMDSLNPKSRKATIKEYMELAGFHKRSIKAEIKKTQKHMNENQIIQLCKHGDPNRLTGEQVIGLAGLGVYAATILWKQNNND